MVLTSPGIRPVSVCVPLGFGLVYSSAVCVSLSLCLSAVIQYVSGVAPTTLSTLTSTLAHCSFVPAVSRWF